MQNNRRQFIRYLGLWCLNLLSSEVSAEKKKFYLFIESNASSGVRDAGLAIIEGVNAAIVAAKERYPNIQVIPKLVNHHGNPSRAIDGLQSFTQNKVDWLGIVGGDDGNVSPAVLQWSQNQGLPYGVGWASNPSFSIMPAGAVSRSLNDLTVLRSVWLLAKAKEKKRWGLLLSNDGLGRAVYDAVLAEKFSQDFPELVGVEWHSLGSTSIGLQYQALQSKGADFIFMATHPEAAISLVNYQTQKQKNTVPSLNSRFIPVVCSSSAWTNKMYIQTQGRVTNSSLIFALPQDFNYIDRSLNLGFSHPASANAYLLTSALIANLAQQFNFSVPMDKAGWSNSKSSFALSQINSELIAPSFMRYTNNGNLVSINPSSIFS